MSSHNEDPGERDALENLKVVEDYVRRTTRWEEGRPARHDAIEALKVLSDQIDWIERGLAEWRESCQLRDRALKQQSATARVAIGHLQTLLNGRLDANQMLAAEKAARDWLESIGEEP